MEKKKEKKDSNFGIAVYIAKSQGNDVPDEAIIAVAKKMGMYPKVLLKNYKSVADINKVFNKAFDELNIEQQNP